MQVVVLVVVVASAVVVVKVARKVILVRIVLLMTARGHTCLAQHVLSDRRVCHDELVPRRVIVAGLWHWLGVVRLVIQAQCISTGTKTVEPCRDEP